MGGDREWIVRRPENVGRDGSRRERRRELPPGLRRLVGLTAVLAPAMHVLSDLLEAPGGGFSAWQLWINYVSFMVLPFLMVGLHAAQSARGGWLSLVGALLYGSSFVYFAGTTMYALVRKIPDYEALLAELGLIYWIHGTLMVLGGLLFGLAILRAGIFPRWTGVLLVIGVLLNLLVGLLPVPDIGQVLGSVLRNAALIGMGAALLRT